MHDSCAEAWRRNLVTIVRAHQKPDALAFICQKLHVWEDVANFKGLHVMIQVAAMICDARRRRRKSTSELD